jgi:EAL domain-containing protein (putative c-di-GMP-specific phosphodiesterase class I)/DNA-binding response OmpR family regulator
VLAVEGEATKRALRSYLEAAGMNVLADDGPLDLDRHADALVVIADPSFVTGSGRSGKSGPPLLCLAALGDPKADQLVAKGAAAGALGRPILRSEIEQVLAALFEGREVGRSGQRSSGGLQNLQRFDGLHVLVADDSAVNREVALEALSRLGVTADVVENGVQAVEAAATGHYALVLMDGSMPEMDGFEACRRIRSAEAAAGGLRLPVVALTAHVVGTAAEAWRDAGMDAVLHKPFTLRALSECIGQFIASTGVSAPEEAKQSGPVAAPTLEADPSSGSAVAAPDEEASPLLDPEMLRQLEDMAATGRQDFVERVYRLYLDHAPRTEAELLDACRAGDLEAVGRAAHALKSMSYNIGASRVAQMAGGIERDARDAGRLSSSADVEALSAALQLTQAAIGDRLGIEAETCESERAEASTRASKTPPEPVASPRLEGAHADSDRPLAAALEEAIARREIRTAYQPLVDRSGRTVVAVEALARWTCPTRGPLSPAVFIPLAERSGLIGRVGELVLRQACLDAAAWPGMTVAINVSAVQLQDPSFISTVEAILNETRCEPTRLEIELTESALLGPGDAAARTMEQLRAKGVKIALDDFGTGYSSLTYLRRFPFDTIKVDKTFVDSITTAADAAAIVHAVVSIGRSLGMKVVAEGVETSDQHRFLAAAGVHMLQGYLFGAPMSAHELTQRLKADGAAVSATA